MDSCRYLISFSCATNLRRGQVKNSSYKAYYHERFLLALTRLMGWGRRSEPRIVRASLFALPTATSSIAEFLPLLEITRSIALTVSLAAISFVVNSVPPTTSRCLLLLSMVVPLGPPTLTSVWADHSTGNNSREVCDNDNMVYANTMLSSQSRWVP